MSGTEQIPTESLNHLVRTLSALRIQFAVVGGVAVALSATPRFTADVDAVMLNMDERLAWLLEELGKVGYRPRVTDPIQFAQRTRVLVLTDENGVGVDLMLGLLPFDEDLVARLRIIEIESTPVPIASPEHLVVMKAIAWRPKDQEDIRQIVVTNPSLDRRFVLDSFAEYAELLEVPERVQELDALLSGNV